MKAIIALIILIAAFCAAAIYLSPNYPATIRYNPFPIFKSAGNDSRITVMIGGDVMLDRSIRKVGMTSGYDWLFRDFAHLFQDADIGIVNLEGPITDYPSRTLLTNGKTTGDMSFTFSLDAVQALINAGIDAVNLANNHTDNFGREGLETTRVILAASGIGWFGDPSNVSGTEKIVCAKSNKKICVAFVGYHEFHSGIDNIIQDIRRLSFEHYPVIVLAHWGDEYATTSLSRVKEKARKFAQAGAIAVIGGHPHVVQDMEWVGNVPVLYSLGNLIFDQYFSEDVKKGQIAELILVGDKKSMHVEKIMLHNTINSWKNGTALVGDPIEFSR